MNVGQLWHLILGLPSSEAEKEDPSSPSHRHRAGSNSFVDLWSAETSENIITASLT